MLNNEGQQDLVKYSDMLASNPRKIKEDTKTVLKNAWFEKGYLIMKKSFFIFLLTTIILGLTGCNGNNSEIVTSSEKQVESSSAQESSVVESSIDEKAVELAKIIEECKQKRDDGDYQYVLDKYCSEEAVEKLDEYKNTEGYDELVKIIKDCLNEDYNSIMVDGVLYGYISTPNSAGGVSIALSITNYDEKEIKYITFDVTPYNAVDDPVESAIRNKSKLELKVTGPVEKNGVTEFDNVWYNKTIKYAVISHITIEYMDGSTESGTSSVKLEQNDEDYDFLLQYGI